MALLRSYFLAIILLSWTYSTNAQSSSCDERRQLRIENITSSSFVLTWKLNDICTDEDIRILEPIEVTVKLKGYRACEFTNNLNNYNGTSKEESFEITLNESMYEQKYIELGSKQELHPFSKYEVQIRSITTRFSKTFEVATKAGYPDTVPKNSTNRINVATFHSIRFYWEASNEEDCRLQNGILDGYRAELWGLDKWVKPKKTNIINGDHYLETKNVEVGFYLAQNLKPYSNYQLRVFNRNIKDDNPSSLDTPELYNHAKYLKINVQTQPGVPKPPTELQATPLATNNKGNSYSSAHLRWVPSYPPTGRISKYRLRRGELNDTGALVFREFRDFDPASERSLCSSSTVDMNSSFHDPYCCVIGELQPNSTYFFEVQVFNLGVSEGSDFSETFNVTTEPFIEALKTTPPTNPDVNHTEKQTNTNAPPIINPGVSTPETANSHGTTIIIVLSIGILLLLVICFVLRRRIRRTTEKIILRSGGGESNIQHTSLNVLNSSDLPNYPYDNGMPNITSPNEATRNTSIASSYTGRAASPSFESHVIRSVVNQIEEIQNRKLPDVPPSEKSVIDTGKNKEVLWGLELQKYEEQESNRARKLPLPPVRSLNYCDPEDSIRSDTSSPRNLNLNYRHEPPDIIPQKNSNPISTNAERQNTSSAIAVNKNIQPISMISVKEECTDTYGYLQPTFLRPNSIQDPPESPDADKSPIPKESYTQITTGLQESIFSELKGFNSSECDTTAATNETENGRPNSSDSDLSFSNLRTYKTDPKVQSNKLEFEDHPLISQTTMNV